MTRTKTTTPAVTEQWRVTWWQDTRGVLTLHEMVYDHAAQAGHAFRQLHASTDPSIIHMRYDIRRARWNASDAVGEAMTPGHVAAVNRRGVACMRAIVAHRHGSDSRGMIVGSLDAVLAADGPIKVEAEEPLVTDTPAGCIVCDYLCQHGLPPAHFVAIEQPSLELEDERF